MDFATVPASNFPIVPTDSGATIRITPGPNEAAAVEAALTKMLDGDRLVRRGGTVVGRVRGHYRTAAPVGMGKHVNPTGTVDLYIEWKPGVTVKGDGIEIEGFDQLTAPAKRTTNVRKPTASDLARFKPAVQPDQPRSPLAQVVAAAIKCSSEPTASQKPPGLVAAALAKAHTRRALGEQAMRKSGSSSPVTQRIAAWGARHGRSR